MVALEHRTFLLGCDTMEIRVCAAPARDAKRVNARERAADGSGQPPAKRAARRPKQAAAAGHSMGANGSDMYSVTVRFCRAFQARCLLRPAGRPMRQTVFFLNTPCLFPQVHGRYAYDILTHIVAGLNQLDAPALASTAAAAATAALPEVCAKWSGVAALGCLE